MDGKKIIIGRNPQCDYVIDQRYESVSGDHCSLTEEINERTGAVVCYRLDEHSTNGTHINAQLIHHSTFYVHQGDHITLGAQYVLEWDKINACFAAQSRKTVNRPAAPVPSYVPPVQPSSYDPRATQRRP
ncbi:MAG: FHA domain-containing protein, partial [Paludibacteraceae bacterium]|nr:FHA domain-containing protein [Paludibacteraceae bacterium]